MRISNNKYVDDEFSPVRYDGVTYGNYEITPEGVIRSSLDHSYKDIFQDSKGRNLVVLHVEKYESVSAYISEILEYVFGKIVSEEYKEQHEEAPFSEIHTKCKKRRLPRVIQDAMKAKESKSNNDKAAISSHKRGIICNETQKEYKSFSAAAKEFGVSYDNFYNSIYDHGMFIHNGEVLTFTKLS